MDDELQKVKKMVRSLLISVKEGLTVRQLEQDYLEFEGKKFPYAHFGFSNSRGFLQSLTDVVQFFRDETGEEKLKQVSDKSTIHIEKLVAKQKTDSRKKKSGRRAPFTRNTLHNFSTRGRRGGGNSRGGRLNQYGRNPQYMSTNVGHFEPRPLLSIPVQRNWSVPPRFRRNYAPTLNEHYRHEEDQDDSDWERDFTEEKRTNQTTNHTSAFHEAKNVQMPKNIEMKVIKSTTPSPTPTSDTNLQNNNCQNYEEVKQKNVETDGRRDLSVRGRVRQGAARGRGISKNTTMVQKPARMTELPHTEHQTDFGIRNISQRSSDLVSGQAWTDPYEYYQSSNQRRSPSSSENQNDDEDKFHDSTMSVQELEEECNISVSVQQKIRQVLGKAPKGLWANRLPIVYKQTFGQELPMRDYGFHSVIEFVSAMPHVVRVERPYEKGDWLLSDANQPKVDSSEHSNQQQQLTSQMTSQKARTGTQRQPGDATSNRNLNELKESVRQVLQAHIDGVSLYQLPDMYEEMTGRVLDPQAFGHRDITSLLVFLSKNNVLEMKFNGPECSRLVAIPTPGVRRFDFLRDVYKPHSHEGQQESKGNSQNLERLPFGVVGPGRCYPPANMNGIEKNATCEVHVSNVVTPGLFWIQKRGDIYALDNLMDDLERVYDDAGDVYRMPLDLMVHGQVCAALYSDSNWHRGIITGVCDDRVQVYYVDYGDTCYVKPSAICFLKEKFLSLPVQAIQAKLAFLLPPEGEQTFSKKSKDVMLEMVMERALLAMIANVDSLGVSLVLVDTRQKVDVFINDYLVNHGLARFQEDLGVERAETAIRGEPS